jgi:hypothetical protein
MYSRERLLTKWLCFACVLVPSVAGATQLAPGNARPDGFIQNQGQWDSRALYMAHSPGVDSWITKTGVTYDFFTQESPRWEKVAVPTSLQPQWQFQPGHRTGHVIELNFLGLNGAPSAESINPDPGSLNYVGFQNRTIPTKSFAEAKLHNLYKGVDIRLYKDSGRPRFDLIVAPGADPSQIHFNYAGASGTSVAAPDTIRVGTQFGPMTVSGLKAYQSSQSDQKNVDCRFSQNGDGSFSFKVGNYDKTKPLVIDPVVFSTLYGATSDDDASCVAVDGLEQPYISGTTTSTDFPTSPGAYNRTVNGTSLYVAELSADGTHYIYSTIINSNGKAFPISMALDSKSRVWITGDVNAAGFPTTSNAFKTTLSGPNDIFAMCLDATGTHLLFSSFLGGTGDNFTNGISIDGNDNIYISGSTDAKDFRTTPGAFQTTNHGFSNAFVMKLTPTFTLNYSTLLGGSTLTDSVGVAVDAQGFAHIAGTTTSPDFPITPGAALSSHAENDVYIAAFDQTGSHLVFATLLGGSGDDFASGVAVDAQDNTYVCGLSKSVDFPTTVGAYVQSDGAGGLFVAKVAPDGGSFPYVTFTNGVGVINALAVDDLGFAYICGTNNSAVGKIPVSTNADQPVNAGPNDAKRFGDAYLQVLNDSGSDLVFGTYWGGSEDETGVGLAVDKARNAFLVGKSNSDVAATKQYPTTPGAFRAFIINPNAPPIKAPFDAYVAKFKVRSIPMLSGFSLSPAVVPGSQATRGTVSLTSGASDSGAFAHLSSDNPSIVHFADLNGAPLPSDTLQVAPGATGGSFLAVAADVQSTFVVHVRVELEGDVRFTSVTVTPWLQSLTVSPFSIVGGNAASGRVQLSGPAPVGGLKVTVISSNPNVAFAADVTTGQAITTFTVPAGQTTSNFAIKTEGVDAPSTVTFSTKVSSPALAASRSEALQVVPASLASLVFTPSVVNGGTTSTGTVSLSGQAGATPVTVTLTLAGGTAPITLPKTTLTIPAFASSVNFSAQTGPVSANAFRTVTATAKGATTNASLFVNFIAISSVDLVQSSVLGGSVLTGHISVSAPAAQGGFTISLASSNTQLLTLSTQVATVAAGSVRTGDFAIHTAVTQVAQTVTITAFKAGYVSRTATLTLRPLKLTLAVTPTTVIGGIQNVKATVTANEAPTSPITITATSGNTAALTVPAVIQLPAGQASVSFVGTSKTVGVAQNVTITFKSSALPTPITGSQTVIVQPLNVTLTLSPVSVTGGVTNSTGTIHLSSPAVQSVTVTLTSDTPSVAQPPTSAVIAAGASTASFTVKTFAVNSDKVATIKATLPGGSFNTAKLTVLAPRVVGLTTAAAQVIGGSSTTATVTLNGPSAGASVALSSSNPAVASLPATVTVSVGAKTATVTVSTVVVNADTNVTLKATFPTGVSVSATVSVLAPRLGGFTLTPNQVVGGSNVVGKVSISVPAPAGGITVHISADPAATATGFVTLPATVVVPQGQTSVSFTIGTKAVSRMVATTLTATFSGSGQQVDATLTINPAG